MIAPPDWEGMVFGEASDGDGRADTDTRNAWSGRLGVSTEWATIHQVHGATVVRARSAGHHGDADAIFTTTPDLPVVVASADCVPVLLAGAEGVGAAHAGWRGAASGVVSELVAAMAAAGVSVRRAAIGPAIGPCCFEVGPEVAARFPAHETATTWGTTSVDLAAVIAQQLPGGVEVWTARRCTMCDETFNSHRRDGSPLRQVSMAWHSG